MVLHLWQINSIVKVRILVDLSLALSHAIFLFLFFFPFPHVVGGGVQSKRGGESEGG